MAHASLATVLLALVVTGFAEAESLCVGFLAQLELSVSREYLVEVHQVFDEVELQLGRLVLGIQFNSFLKLMLSTLVLAR